MTRTLRARERRAYNKLRRWARREAKDRVDWISWATECRLNFELEGRHGLRRRWSSVRGSLAMRRASVEAARIRTEELRGIIG